MRASNSGELRYRQDVRIVMEGVMKCRSRIEQGSTTILLEVRDDDVVVGLAKFGNLKHFKTLEIPLKLLLQPPGPYLGISRLLY